MPNTRKDIPLTQNILPHAPPAAKLLDPEARITSE